MIDVDKPGFEQVLGRRFDASNREITITLHRPLHLHGTVTDAVTGQPIERFDADSRLGPVRLLEAGSNGSGDRASRILATADTISAEISFPIRA